MHHARTAVLDLALIRDGRGRPLDLYITSEHAPPRLGAIHLGIAGGEIGTSGGRDVRLAGGASGFLDGAGGRSTVAGERVIAQITGEEHDGKRDRLSRDIRLPGLFVIYDPLAETAGKGRKGRVRLSRALTQSMSEPLMQRLDDGIVRAGGQVIVRRTAALAQPDAVLGEAERLISQWQEASSDSGTGGPKCLLKAPGCLELAVTDYFSAGIARIESAVDGALSRAEADTLAMAEAGGATIVADPDPAGFLEAWDVWSLLAGISDPTVRLPGGGMVHFEQTRALVAIDVDAGGRKAMAANSEAAEVLTRHVRLRGLSGTLVVDFVSMNGRSEWRSLIDGIATGFEDDPAGARAFGPSPLGLVEISRARRRAPLSTVLQGFDFLKP